MIPWDLSPVGWFRCLFSPLTERATSIWLQQNRRPAKPPTTDSFLDGQKIGWPKDWVVKKPLIWGRAKNRDLNSLPIAFRVLELLVEKLDFLRKRWLKLRQTLWYVL